MAFFGLGRSVEQKLFLAILDGELNRVKHLLEKKPSLDAAEKFVWRGDTRKFSFTLPYELADGTAILRLTPVELAAKIQEQTGRSSAAMIDALVAYGYPPPHRCDISLRDPAVPCRFVCSCGASEERHAFQRVNPCLERCARCGAEQGEHRSSRVYTDPLGRIWEKDGPYLDVCRRCHEVLAHSALADLPPDQVRLLEYVSQGECTKRHVQTGRVVAGVHPSVKETCDTNLDDDLLRSFYRLRCNRCTQVIASRSPGYDYAGSRTDEWDASYRDSQSAGQKRKRKDRRQREGA